jgi:hypothetical protein
MDELPIAPSCALDEDGLRRQLGRYRAIGRRARVLDHTPRRIELELDEDVDPATVEDAIAIERDCCPFFSLAFAADERRLTVSVDRAEHEPAIDAIAYALGLSGTAGGAG